MDKKVRLKSGGGILETDFEHAQQILRIDKHNVFKVADPSKFKFENNELIIQPSPKDGVKSIKSGKRK